MPVLDKQNEQHLEMAALLKSIAHPTRLAIIEAMAREGGEYNGGVLEVNNLAPGTIQQNLRELKKAGIIKGRIYGTGGTYSLEVDKLLKLREHVFQFVGELEKQVKS